ncbi:MAG: transcription-repair coupling factor [Coriobacteriia bacterium]|nr:transcription-repair coupling factor [Coriobacteriia bacterium]
MLIDALTQTFERTHALDGFWGKLDSGKDATLAVASSARPLLVAAAFARKPRTTLVACAGEENADIFARNLAAFLGDDRVLRLLEPSSNLFNLQAEADPSEIAHRNEALWSLKNGRDLVVVASSKALLRKLPAVQYRFCEPVVLEQGVDLLDGTVPGAEDYSELVDLLVSKGYENTGSLMGPGSFCTHGGTLDVWPGNLKAPVRLDFFGDELEEIRRFLPSTGQTIAPLERVEIYPVSTFNASPQAAAHARERLVVPAESDPGLRELLEALEDDSRRNPEALLGFLYDSTSCACDYLCKDALMVLLEPRSIFDDALHIADALTKQAQGSSLTPEMLYLGPKELDFGFYQRATYVSMMRVGATADEQLVVKRIDAAGSIDKIYGRLRSFCEAGFTVVLSVPNASAREDAKLAMLDAGIPFDEVLDLVGDTPRKLIRGHVSLVDVDIPLGMNLPAVKTALVSFNDASSAMRRTNKRRVDATEITFPFKPGDYVVHAFHGIAYFNSIVRRDIGGVERDYLLLEYAEKDKLYIPVEQLDRVSRYVGPEGSSPRLTRLNTSDWNRAVGRARKATKQLAFDLVDVYTRRSVSKGYRYSPDTPWQKQMEDDFPFDETPDQLAAIADVKADMQAARPMDRLICGDVGFGKTEVALRAAFKATQDKKQAMVLCPTTILAQQHYSSFKDRFEPYGVAVEVLSRFRTPAQQKAALEGFANGGVSVLVGTHRLLSRDVNPHDLGLVIIDEEQRFGVGHKEQLKNMRESVDVLTLSATPIPRTMQMGLSGVRDMSLILTPPGDRRPVEVHVGEWDPDVVSDAIRRELARKGQVYYVSNRVRSIKDATERVHEAAGEARVGVAHGKMNKEELERVMEDFNAGEIDVLVATTIIESGIDNPHSNTLIIEDSQRLGLAQMYQLKGRVGRSNLQAYAYFLFPDDIPLTEEAQARLTAINEHSDLGSGMQVALRDLEIRGAGDLLGAEQSGNMSAVGFDLFAQMLAQAVNLTREGQNPDDDYLPPALSDIVVNLPDPTYIPEEFIPDADERVLLYRKIAGAESVEVVEELFGELEKKYSDIPEPTINQFAKARLKAFAYKQGIKNISLVAGKLVVEPLLLAREQQQGINRGGGRYLADKQRVSVPMSEVGATDNVTTLVAALAYLEKLVAERDEIRARQKEKTPRAQGVDAKPLTMRSISETGGSITGHKGKGAERFADREARRAERAAKRAARKGSAAPAVPSMYDNPKLAAKRDQASDKGVSAQKGSASPAKSEESTAERKARELKVTRVVPSRRGRSGGSSGKKGGSMHKGRKTNRMDW